MAIVLAVATVSTIVLLVVRTVVVVFPIAAWQLWVASIVGRLVGNWLSSWGSAGKAGKNSSRGDSVLHCECCGWCEKDLLMLVLLVW